MAWRVAFSAANRIGIEEPQVHFGIALSGRGPLARPDIMARLAEKAEALRFASAFVTDHVVIPLSTTSVYPYSATGKFAGDWTQGYLEPLTVMAWLARVTARMRIGVSVLVVPYRNPVVTAKMLATMDVLSGGRIILGAGVGWMREEFEALHAAPYAERGRVTDEYLHLMRECWTREPVDFTGAYYQLPTVSAMPKPVQPAGIPIWIGGHTDAALRRAGELGDAWHPIGLRPPAGLHPDEYRQKAEVVREWAGKAGRRPGSVELTLRAALEIAPRRAKPAGGDRVPLRGTADEVVADIARYHEAGVAHLVFDPVAPDAKTYAAVLERFAEDVRPRIKVRKAEPAGSPRGPRRPGVR